MRNNENLPAGDPVIRELWAVKDAMAADCGYDVKELFRRIQASQLALEGERCRLHQGSPCRNVPERASIPAPCTVPWQGL